MTRLGVAFAPMASREEIGAARAHATVRRCACAKFFRSSESLASSSSASRSAPARCCGSHLASFTLTKPFSMPRFRSLATSLASSSTRSELRRKCRAQDGARSPPWQAAHRLGRRSLGKPSRLAVLSVAQMSTWAAAGACDATYATSRGGGRALSRRQASSFFWRNARRAALASPLADPAAVCSSFISPCARACTRAPLALRGNAGLLAPGQLDGRADAALLAAIQIGILEAEVLKLGPGQL